MIKCGVCGNKNKLYLFECKCDNLYCLKHIRAEVHRCEKLSDIQTEKYEKNKDNLINSRKKERLEWIQ